MAFRFRGQADCDTLSSFSYSAVTYRIVYFLLPLSALQWPLAKTFGTQKTPPGRRAASQTAGNQRFVQQALPSSCSLREFKNVGDPNIDVRYEDLYCKHSRYGTLSFLKLPMEVFGLDCILQQPFPTSQLT